MRPRNLGILMVLLSASSCLAQVPRRDLVEQFRRVASQTNDNINDDAPGSKQATADQLLTLAKQTGASRQEAQAILLLLVDEGLRASGESDAWLKHRIANGSLSALGDIADATALERFVTIAEIAPKNLLSSVARAALTTASRVNPAELQTVSRKLLSGPSHDQVYGLLGDVLQFQLPSDPVERNLRVKLIVGLFKEGLHNPQYEDRIYLDKVIEEYDEAFRQSEERRHVLQELAGSSNPIVKRYAEGKLQELLVVSNPPVSVETVGESKKQEPQAPSEAPSIAPSTHVNEAQSSSWLRKHMYLAAMCAATVAGSMIIYLWRRK